MDTQSADPGGAETSLSRPGGHNDSAFFSMEDSMAGHLAESVDEDQEEGVARSPNGSPDQGREDAPDGTLAGGQDRVLDRLNNSSDDVLEGSVDDLDGKIAIFVTAVNACLDLWERRGPGGGQAGRQVSDGSSTIDENEGETLYQAIEGFFKNLDDFEMKKALLIIGVGNVLVRLADSDELRDSVLRRLADLLPAR
ncbi:uncharacterized protein PFL1_02965 [Pseudozyma flocculosa PF-1]|uniref:Uncharacterized protein n=1 Tax=Pseudozyma flocculosa PF-1 TaxID=1277687 RepID=A0A061HGG4_9BASI|nr:uncharacterized protein PFL1_02965 [Pseudozyma flocculosa PF-1]EPQ29746.1 hypothetical protein PFL1_02965 [Pseudozyma flocculosa PF-1]